jgi:hypothetical protein
VFSFLEYAAHVGYRKFLERIKATQAMVVAIAFCPSDEGICLKQAQWIKELGGAKGHTALLAYDARCNPDRIEKELLDSFDELKTIRVVDNLAHWPESANNMFSQCARHVEFFFPKAPFWFFLEPDCIPLSPGSFDALQIEHKQGKKPFTGAKVEVGGVPIHLSGNAIYSTPLYKYAGEALIAHDIAFDVFAAPKIVPQAHWTDLIAHSWDRDYETGRGLHNFPDWKSVEDQVIQPHPRAVFYHGDKSGTLIDRLRENLRKAGEVDAEENEEKKDERQKDQDNGKPLGLKESAVAVTTKAAPLLCDIFIKTYPKDYPWLKYCLRSIERFCEGFRRVVVVSPETNSKEFMEAVTGYKINILPICNPNEIGDGYLFQQSVKLHADEYTDADWILFTDCDTIFTCPVSPDTYLKDGKFVWMMTPYSKVDAPWKAITEKFSGPNVDFEFMRRHPAVLPRWLLQGIRQFCIDKHRTTMHAYVTMQPDRGFSEFNALGAYAYLHHRDKFNWIDTETVPERDWPALTVDQQFSHNPIPVEKWKNILRNDGFPLITDANILHRQPWQDRLASQKTVIFFCTELKRYCTAPRHTKYVRDQLKQAGVTK